MKMNRVSNQFNKAAGRRGAKATSDKLGNNKRLGLCKCGKKRLSNYTSCRECRNESSRRSQAKRYARSKHKNVHEVHEMTRNDVFMGSTILLGDHIMGCKYPGCSWTGKRRDYWRVHLREKHR